MEQENKKFYQKTWVMWLTLILFWPVGVFLLWKYSTYTKKTKCILTAVLGAIVVMGFSGNKDTTTYKDTTTASSQVSTKDKTANKETTSSSQSSNKENKKPAAPEFTINVDGIGKVKGGVSSNVGLAVIGVEERNSLGDEFFNEQAQGKFVIVKIAVTNNQKDAVTIDSSSFNLIDEQEREFDVSVEGSTALQMSNGNAKGFLSKINPGISTTFVFPFDVPKDVKGLKLKARGGFTGDEISLPLQVQTVQ